MKELPMLLLGLTGSIGMGKSTTAKLFQEAGVPVYDADATVHKIYEGEAVPAVEAAFPGSTANGKVDRQKLSAMVVNNAEAMKRLETIVHPMLRSHQLKFLSDAEVAAVTTGIGANAGDLVLVVADLFARTAVDFADLPIGMLTALLGGPSFFWLLRRERNRAGGWA